MIVKKKYNISLSPETWEQLGKFADEMGTTRSGIIELMARQLVMAETTNMGKWVGGVLQEVFDIFKSGKGPGKRRLE